MSTSQEAYDCVPKCAAIVMLTILAVWFASLAQKPVKGGPKPIVCLELAPTVSAASNFLQAWKQARPETWRADLNRAQLWDTWFICAYAPLFALLCWIAANHFAERFGGLGAVGHALAGGQLLAGALDFVENAAMQKTIDAGFASAPWPLIGATASGIKWLLILAFGIYAIGAGIHWAVGLVDR